MRRVVGVVEIVEELRRGLVGLQVGGARVFPDYADLRARRKPPRVHRIDGEGVVGVVAVVGVRHGGFFTTGAQARKVPTMHVAHEVSAPDGKRHAVGEAVARAERVAEGVDVAAAE